MIINKALIKHKYSMFKLDILEYCDPKAIASREQFFINYLKPEYNILKVAYSSLGYKHSKEALLKINKNLAKLNSEKAIKVKVTNIETNVSHVYASLTETAQMFNSNKTTITKYIRNSLLLNGIYKLEAELPVSNYDSNYLNHPNSIEIEVTDLDLNTITVYTSVRAAARSLGIGHTTISNYFNRNQFRPCKGRYIFKKIIKS
jgi:hypothetical protein